VQFAPVNSNGTVGAWSATTSFSTGRYGHTSVAYNGYLYVIGGYNGTALNDVQFAALTGPAARAAYSRLVDLGSDQLIGSFQYTGAGPGGITNLTYATAPGSTGILSRVSVPCSISGYSYNVSQCARYFWVRFDMDDTASATADDDATFGRNSIQDFTVTYSTLQAVGDNVSATKATSVHLAWLAVSGATSYNVRRCTFTGDSCSPATIANTSNLYFDDFVLGNGSSYWYNIQAVNGSCVSQ